MSEKLIKSVEKNINLETLESFSRLQKASSKHDLIKLLIKYLHEIFYAEACSFVQNENGEMKEICSVGNTECIRQNLSDRMIYEIYHWVTKRKKSATIKLAHEGNFLFLPVTDSLNEKYIEHGMVVLKVNTLKLENASELKKILSVMLKISASMLTRFSGYIESEDLRSSKEQSTSDLKLTSKIVRVLSSVENQQSRLNFKILEESDDLFNGNVCWVEHLGDDISVVLIAQIFCSGTSSAMLSGYILGEMNSLKSNAEIILKPAKVLERLNSHLHPVYLCSGLTVNAWYGVFNLAANKVRFSNASHVDPYVIGMEQQVSVLRALEKNTPLGINSHSVFTESVNNISRGSRVVICTNSFVDQVAKVGERYDNSWLPQVLETVGALPFNEMCKSLKSILSENQNGTVKSSPRLALLLEVPS